VPISFNQKTTAIVFERKLLDSKIKLNNPHLLNVLTDYAEKLLKKITTKDNIKDQVRRFIKHNLQENDVLDVNLAAKKLNMSRHTLYRKLKKEGVSFQSLAEEVRQAEAKHYLQENNISISEVAYLLGFSELSAFSRAFKRWTGESPAQFRTNAISK
jgi:AraC-like DNA-binding protein